jgi:hypothetical protein
MECLGWQILAKKQGKKACKITPGNAEATTKAPKKWEETN